MGEPPLLLVSLKLLVVLQPWVCSCWRNQHNQLWYFTGGCSFEPIAGMECQSGSTQKNEKMKCHSGFPKCHMATACIKQIADEMPFLASAPCAIPFTSSKQVLQTVLYFGSWAAALPFLYGFLVSKLSCWFWRRRKWLQLVGLFSIGSPHRLWLAFGLASGIECWCHTMALPQSLTHLWFFSFWAEVQLADLQTWCQWWHLPWPILGSSL